MALQKKKKEMKFSTQDFFSICDQIRSLLRKSLTENFVFCAVWFSQARTFILIIAGLSDAYDDFVSGMVQPEPWYRPATSAENIGNRRISFVKKVIFYWSFVIHWRTDVISEYTRTGKVS